MKEDNFIKIIQELKKEPKKKFVQTYSLIVVLKDINIKNPEEMIDIFLELKHSKGKKNKVCALVGPEMMDEAKRTMDFVVSIDEIEKYKDKKLARKLAEQYDFFVAQANLMGKIASAVGPVLGSRGKMPNPKAGCIVAPKTNLEPLKKRLENTVRLITKNSLVVQAPVGNENMQDKDVAENALSVYNAILHKLPNEENNIKSVFLKLTMSKPIKVI